MQIIVFTVGDKNYGISTTEVEEISEWIVPTVVPKSPYWVEGLINLRGNVITLVDLSKLLGQNNDKMCYNNVILIRSNEEEVGLMVTDVVEVTRIDPKDIEEVSQDKRDGFTGVIRLNDTIVNVVDIDILLSKNEG